MLCERLELRERNKAGKKDLRVTDNKPRRYCQKRLVNPLHEEDPRWIDVLERFRCNEHEDVNYYEDHNLQEDTKEDDLFLSVQTLQLKGVDQISKRPRTSFKYKTVTDGNTHRMFVKQVVANEEQYDDDRSSQLTCYYYDDYAKYLSNNDPSRPPSGKSSIFLQSLGMRLKANKAVQVDFSKTGDIKKTRKTDKKFAETDLSKIKAKGAVAGDVDDALAENALKDTKILFQKSGKRKSLTISRTQSPETVQVIRVDVVCNCNTSSASSEYEDAKPHKEVIETLDKNNETVNTNNPQFTSKYLLANTEKTLEENVSGGAKVTLLCKTFRLTDRKKLLFNRKPLDIAKVTSVQR